ncbi:MAG: glycosyltransferase family 39 protein [Chloroflexi bacterium]|nr:glycosyltransferase family 39 protein [Chloroflexota bacterium]
MFGLNSESAHYAHWLLTEVPFTFLLVVALALALRSQSAGRRRDLFSCGVGFGLATLVRVIAGALVVPVTLVLFFTSRSRDRARRLQDVGMLLLGFGVVLAPWVGRNFETFGHVVITSRLGVNLIRRAPRAAEPLSAYPAWLAASAWMATNPLSNVVYPISRFQWGSAYEDNAIWDFHVNDQVRYNGRYESVCQQRPDTDACYAEIGLAFAMHYPVGYAAQSVFALVMLLFAPLPGPQALEHNGLVWLGLAGMAGLLAGHHRGRAPALVLTVLGAYVAASIVVDTQVRYLLPVLPIFALFGGVTVARLVNVPRGFLRARRTAHI